MGGRESTSQKRAGSPPAPVESWARVMTDPINAADAGLMSDVQAASVIGLVIRFAIALAGGVFIGAMVSLVAGVGAEVWLGAALAPGQLEKALSNSQLLGGNIGTVVLASCLMFTSAGGAWRWWWPQQWGAGIMNLIFAFIGGVTTLGIFWWIAQRFFGVPSFFVPTFVEPIEWASMTHAASWPRVAVLSIESLMNVALVGVIGFLGVRQAAAKNSLGVFLALVVGLVVAYPQVFKGDISWTMGSGFIVTAVWLTVLERTHNIFFTWVTYLMLSLVVNRLGWELAARAVGG